MDYFWRAISLQPDLSRRLDGHGDQETNYKYNSLLVLDHNVEKPPRYTYPRHGSGEWVVRLRGLFHTIVSLSDGILSSCTEKTEGEKEEEKRGERRIYSTEIEIHGGAVQCCIAWYPECVLVITSDAIESDLPTCADYLYHTIPYFVPQTHNPIRNPSFSTSTRVIDTYSAPALEIAGTRFLNNQTGPVIHRGMEVAGEVKDVLLDIETSLEIDGDTLMTFLFIPGVMDYFWRAISLQPELSRRLDGHGDQETNYKYNSLLVLDHDVEKPPRYTYPRHGSGEWVVRLRGLFHTILSLSDGIMSSCTEKTEGEKEGKKEGEKEGSGERMIYSTEIEIHGGAVQCCIAWYPECVLVITSDAIESDLPTCADYLYHTIPYFVPHTHNPIRNPAFSTSTRVIDTYSAPALEIAGTRFLNNQTGPVIHRGMEVAGEVKDVLLDIETSLEIDGDVSVSSRGVVVVSYPNILYSSLPSAIQPVILQTLYYRELLTINTGYVTWFNRFYKHFISSSKRQAWYLLVVSKNGLTTGEVLGIFGKPSKDTVLGAARHLEELLDKHCTSLKQHLPSDGILLKHCTVLGYKYGMNRVYYAENRYQSLVEYHHSNKDAGLGNPGKFVVRVDEGEVGRGEFVGQRVIGGKVFTVVYRTLGIHNVETIFTELGI
eukprot:sb/3462809/